MYLRKSLSVLSVPSSRFTLCISGFLVRNWSPFNISMGKKRVALDWYKIEIQVHAEPSVKWSGLLNINCKHTSSQKNGYE